MESAPLVGRKLHQHLAAAHTRSLMLHLAGAVLLDGDMLQRLNAAVLMPARPALAHAAAAPDAPESLLASLTAAEATTEPEAPAGEVAVEPAVAPEASEAAPVAKATPPPPDAEAQALTLPDLASMTTDEHAAATKIQAAARGRAVRKGMATRQAAQGVTEGGPEAAADTLAPPPASRDEEAGDDMEAGAPPGSCHALSTREPPEGAAAADLAEGSTATPPPPPQSPPGSSRVPAAGKSGPSSSVAAAPAAALSPKVSTVSLLLYLANILMKSILDYQINERKDVYMLPRGRRGRPTDRGRRPRHGVCGREANCGQPVDCRGRQIAAAS